MLLKKEDAKIKSKVALYLEHVNAAGFEMISQDKVSVDTIRELEKELVSLDEYLEILRM